MTGVASSGIAGPAARQCRAARRETGSVASLLGGLCNLQTKRSHFAIRPRFKNTTKIGGPWETLWPSGSESAISPGNKQVAIAVNKSTHLVLARTNEKYPSRNPL